MKDIAIKDLAIYGAGDNSKEIFLVIKAINEVKLRWNFIGFFDDGIRPGKVNRYGDVIGDINTLNKWKTELDLVISIYTPKIIEEIVNKISNPLISFPNIIAPNVHFFDYDAVEIGRGNIFVFGSRVSCDVEIGDFNLISAFVALGHDVKIGDFNVLGPSTRISGRTKVGNTNYFGVQSIVLQGIQIGDSTRIGVNSTVIKNTENGFLYYGNPAKRISL